MTDPYFSPPSCTEQWKQVLVEFGEQWQFPRVIGAIDGKHSN